MQRYLEKARSTRRSALSLRKGPAPAPEAGPKAAAVSAMPMEMKIQVLK